MNKPVAINRKAHRDYAILETIECGIELKGSEVKSLRSGKINLNDSFARVEDGEVMLYNTHITPYAEASYLNVEPARLRRFGCADRLHRAVRFSRPDRGSPKPDQRVEEGPFR